MQEKGHKHIRYIRELAVEIWCKENHNYSAGKEITIEDAIQKALQLHRHSLMREQNELLSDNPRRSWW